MTRSLGVIRYSALNAAADFSATYTWRSWLFGWVGRMFSQVVFFSLAGQAIGGPGREQALFVGNAVMITVIEALMVVSTSVRERSAGTLPLVVAAPAELFLVFFGRSIQWVLSGVATSLLAIFLLAPFFHVRWHAADVPVICVILFLTSIGSYCLGLSISVIVLNHPPWRNVVSNTSYLAMMAFCGVEVPTSYWPAPVRLATAVIPLTQGLRGIQGAAAGESGRAVWLPAGLTCLAAAGWFVISLMAFRLFAERGRKDGSIDNSS